MTNGSRNGEKAAGRAVPLSLRILFWMSVTALVPLLFTSWQFYRETREGVVALQAGHLHSVVAVKKALIRSWMGEIRSDTLLIAADTCVQGCALAGEPSATDSPMTVGCSRKIDIAFRDPSYLRISLYDPAMRLLTHSARPGFAEPVPDGFLRELAESQAYRSRSTGEAEGPPRHLAGSAILGPNGDPLGYTVLQLDLERAMGGILSGREGLGRTGRALLSFPGGRTIASTADPGAFIPDPPSMGGRVQTLADSRGGEVLGVTETVPPENWRLRVEIEGAEAFAILASLSGRAILTLAVTLVLVLVLAFHLSSRLSRPLRRLAETAGRIASGAYHERFSEVSGDSGANAVAVSFNRTLEAIEAAHLRLVHAAALAAVGELSLSIAHEIRNPLATIRMNLQAFQPGFAGDPARAELCELALRQTARIERMLTDLLGFARPPEVRFQRVRFGHLAQAVLRATEAAAAAKKLRVEPEDACGDESFQADPDLLERLLVNLVLNAVQAAPEGGRVGVSGAVREGRVCLEVTDNGPGIPAQALERLFQPFFTTRENGTGLGLANVRRIAASHGGEAAAENLPGGGARFRVTFPAKHSNG